MLYRGTLQFVVIGLVFAQPINSISSNKSNSNISSWPSIQGASFKVPSIASMITPMLFKHGQSSSRRLQANIVGGATVNMNIYLDAKCTESFEGEGPHRWQQSADDKLCWNLGTDMSVKVACDVDGKLDVKMWLNKEENGIAPKCTGEDASSDDYHLNGMDRADAMAFLTGGGCMQQPKSICDPTDTRDGKACYMYAKLDTPLPEDSFPSACVGATPGAPAMTDECKAACPGAEAMVKAMAGGQERRLDAHGESSDAEMMKRMCDHMDAMKCIAKTKACPDALKQDEKEIGLGCEWKSKKCEAREMEMPKCAGDNMIKTWGEKKCDTDFTAECCPAAKKVLECIGTECNLISMAIQKMNADAGSDSEKKDMENWDNARKACPDAGIPSAAAVSATASEGKVSSKYLVSTIAGRIATTLTTTAATSTKFLKGSIKTDSSGRYFGQVGKGQCTTNLNEPVRGKSKSSMTHTECRAACQEPCSGYSFSPCEGICIVHSMSSTNLLEADGWRQVNGGPRIARTSGKCGAVCFVVAHKCPSGSLPSNGANAFFDAIPFGKTVDVPCPAPYGGILKVRCFVEGTERVSGRCGLACPASFFFTDGFNVSYPQLTHDTNSSVPCPQGSGGTLYLGCIDGHMRKNSGSCGLNCVSGSVKVGDALVPYDEFVHGTTVKRPCPQGFWGRTVLSCIDGTASKIEGECYAHCGPGNVMLSGPGVTPAYHASHGQLNHNTFSEVPCVPETAAQGLVKLHCYSGIVSLAKGSPLCTKQCQNGTVKSGAAEVGYTLLNSGTTTSFPCPVAYNGTLELNCDDGVVKIVSGICKMHCVPGSVTSNSIAVSHGHVKHGMKTNLSCTPGFTGPLQTRCDDGQMVLEKGMCGQDCNPGSVTSNSVNVNYGKVAHDTEMDLPCPDPYVGSLKIRCYDNSVRVSSGFCGKGCAKGELRSNGARIVYEAMKHEVMNNITCPGESGLAMSYSGWVVLRCVNARVSRISGNCRRDCGAGEIRTAGLRFPIGKLLEGKQVDMMCQGQGNVDYGHITVKCVAGAREIIGGSCGSSCTGREFESPATRYQKTTYPDIGHMQSTEMPCPSNLTGKVFLDCVNGLASWSYGTCGPACPAGNTSSGGAVFIVPQIGHNSSAEVMCPPPFKGNITYTCMNGQRNSSGVCLGLCHEGTAPIDAVGTRVAHPDMPHGTTSMVDCPPGYAGQVELQCSSGVTRPVPGSGCYLHCLAGKIMVGEATADEYELEHNSVKHNKTTMAECPLGYSGNITVGCNDGEPFIISGICERDCRAGKAFIYTGMMVEHPKFRHNQLLRQEKCPQGFAGTYALGCKAGLVSVTRGLCQRHCEAGTARVGNVDVKYGAMLNANFSQPKCPSSGRIVLKCDDGKVTVLEGRCWADCPQGAAKDENDVTVLHGSLKHEDSGMGTCGEGATGQVRISCYDGTVTVERANSSEVRCYRHCPASKVTTNENVEVPHGDLEHNTEATVDCPSNVLGTIRIGCFDGQTTLLDGGCGTQNCAAGTVDSNNAKVSHPAMNHGKKSGPYSCPAPFSGEVAIGCDTGKSHASVVTLYDEDYDETFTLCDCCELQQSAPPPPVLEPKEQKVSLIAVAVGVLAGCLCAAMSGYYFLRAEKVKVAPAEGGTRLSRLFKRGSKGDTGKAKGKSEGRKAAPEETGIKGKLRKALSVFVGVFLCGYLLTRVADCLRNACENCKDRMPRKKQKPTKVNPKKELKEAAQSEPAPSAPAIADAPGAPATVDAPGAPAIADAPGAPAIADTSAPAIADTSAPAIADTPPNVVPEPKIHPTPEP